MRVAILTGGSDRVPAEPRHGIGRRLRSTVSRDAPLNPVAFCAMSLPMTDQRPPLTDAAKRALAEADARRKAAAEAPPAPREEGGRPGPEPVRFGDWEVKGIATDF